MTDRLHYRHIFLIEDELATGYLTLGARLNFPEAWIHARLQEPVNPSKGRAVSYTPELAAIARQIIAEDLDHFGYDANGWTGF